MRVSTYLLVILATLALCSGQESSTTSSPEATSTTTAAAAATTVSAEPVASTTAAASATTTSSPPVASTGPPPRVTSRPTTMTKTPATLSSTEFTATTTTTTYMGSTTARAVTVSEEVTAAASSPSTFKVTTKDSRGAGSTSSTWRPEMTTEATPSTTTFTASRATTASMRLKGDQELAGEVATTTTLAVATTTPSPQPVIQKASTPPVPLATGTRASTKKPAASTQATSPPPPVATETEITTTEEINSSAVKETATEEVTTSTLAPEESSSGAGVSAGSEGTVVVELTSEIIASRTESTSEVYGEVLKSERVSTGVEDLGEDASTEGVKRVDEGVSGLNAEEVEEKRRVESRLKALSCDISLPPGSRAWRGNLTRELSLPYRVKAKPCPTQSSSQTSGSSPQGYSSADGDLTPPAEDCDDEDSTYSWDGHIEVQSGDVLLVKIEESRLLHPRKNPKGGQTAALGGSSVLDGMMKGPLPDVWVYQVSRAGHERCDASEGVLLDVAPITVDGRAMGSGSEVGGSVVVIPLYDRDLADGNNLLVVVSKRWAAVWWSSRCTTATWPTGTTC